MNTERFLDDLYLYIDISDLRKFGLSEEEIFGYIDFFQDFGLTDLLKKYYKTKGDYHVSFRGYEGIGKNICEKGFG